MADEYLTVQEAAAVLKLSIGTMRRYVRSGKLKSTKLDRQHRIKRADLDPLLAHGTGPSVAEPARQP
jgi:excisionase family DNA binding protein